MRIFTWTLGVIGIGFAIMLIGGFLFEDGEITIELLRPVTWFRQAVSVAATVAINTCHNLMRRIGLEKPNLPQTA